MDRNWTLWIVQGKDPETKEPVRLGFLVTHKGEHHEPIAFVRGVGDWSLQRALAIRKRPDYMGKAVDLRRRPVPERLLGMLLLPVDSLGRVIRNDGTFAAGMFVLGERGKPAFMTYTHGGLEFVLGDQKINGVQAEQAPSLCRVGSKRRLVNAA